MTRAALAVELKRDEGIRLMVYDDATGEPIRSGTLVKGHPTIGVGRALDVRGLSSIEADYLLYQDIAAFQLGLQQRYAWFGNLDDVRQRALVNMAFNLGLEGIAEFHNMLRAIANQDYSKAADEMEKSHWYAEVGARAHRLTVAMRTGIAQ